ncbi:hypothetical protein EG328_004018 [Venturia inaequalis]|uniref:Uncharacterized protein n=1 Tax=Venturia inaequalis TaxID=5025 RepID=A0A8H3UNZ4_VENIN|nr:hypothetical protein EG328_004018 [Venturia inaequalis]
MAVAASNWEIWNRKRTADDAGFSPVPHSQTRNPGAYSFVPAPHIASYSPYSVPVAGFTPMGPPPMLIAPSPYPVGAMAPPPLPGYIHSSASTLSELGSTPTAPSQSQPSRGVMMPVFPSIESTPDRRIFLPLGRDSADSPLTAAARQEQTTIQREHRAARRASEDIEDTPPLHDIRTTIAQLEREQDAAGSPTSHRAIPDSSQTVQPLTGSQLPLTPSTSQSHGGARTGAGRPARAVPEHPTYCYACRQLREIDIEARRAQRKREHQNRDLTLPDPAMDFGDAQLMSQPAVTDEDYELIKTFHKDIANDCIEDCSRCNTRWFDQRLNSEGVY